MKTRRYEPSVARIRQSGSAPAARQPKPRVPEVPRVQPQVQPRVQQVEVGERGHGQRLDNFLGKFLADVPRSHVFRVIRKGEVRRDYNNDWIAEAEKKSIITAEEAKSLAELRDLTASVIAVDDFDAAELALRYQPAGNAGAQSFNPPRDSIAAE